MIRFWTAAAFALFSVAATGTAKANVTMCASPVDAAEVEICQDPYLRGLAMEVEILLQRVAEMEGGEVPDAVHIPHAHWLIERSECGANFRCLEAAIRGELDDLNTTVLEWQDTPLVLGLGVPFVPRDGLSSVGADLMAWNDPSNFGWSKYQCQLRCAMTEACIAAHYDALTREYGRYGYCTMKSAITIPLVPWQGGLLIRQSAMDF